MTLLRSLIPAAALVALALPAMASAQTALTCSTTAQTLTGDPGTVMTVTCPAGCGTQSVWGTGTYSDDSSVCTAAIHAGVLTNAGGTAIITIAPGLSAYPASTMNGITTSSWGAWSRSFTVAPAGATPIECTTNAQSIEGAVGTTATLMCPPCTAQSIWGTGTYSDDSSICTAAAHAGVTQLGVGGQVTITIQPGLQDYPMSTQNGVTSSHWGAWSRSFTVAP